ncbi:hypothetical protein [Streptomyces sp. NPDC001914]|uniref:hypothetical protein n=1 Tax=Streptomyces sp. NPDC001914 TaxID=3364623 RepID=UPI00368B9976
MSRRSHRQTLDTLTIHPSPASVPGFVVPGGPMLRRYRTQYDVPGLGRRESTWWQLGNRIWRHRVRPVH